ncbi:antA/AntB antirepressor family protein [Bartonella sp. WD16.2]|uniref:antA/AntB antirepressor family protein n=1 Tax=Bartonella sp. WD16.2 TaxID=1933904 RepID=UPI00099A41E4|nr:antA/AntB antirepressor family protein [Bartonella sp. WD16.2]AQX19898.1 Phage anti-repressor protein [Bartonella sp. WD16.2]
MNTLITISEQTVGQETVQTVNARELHVFLEVGKKFADWIKDRITKYSFVENQDYIVFPNFGENLQGSRPSKDYAITLDMAKELSMVENNKKGKQARQYFIECERKAKQPLDLVSALQNPLAIRQLLLESITQLEDLRTEVKTLKPKAEALESLKRSDGLFALYEAAKMLDVRPTDFTKHLQFHKWAYRNFPGGPLLPCQDKINRGLMDCVIHPIQKSDGTKMSVSSAKITVKGLACLREQFHGGVQ